jgi:hypothetical protein
MVAPEVGASVAARSPRGAGRLLAAAYISFYGDWLTTTALVVLLLRLTGSPAAPAGYILARVAPRVVAAGYSGGLGERWGPTRVIATAWVAQGLITASIVPLYAAHSLVSIYVAVVASQFLNAIARPSIGTAIPRLVAPNRIARFNTLLSGADSSSILVAPAMGSVLLQISGRMSGPSVLLILDAVSFALAAVLIAGLVPAPPAGSRAARKPRSRSSGIRILLSDDLLRLVVVTFAAGTITAAATQSILVVAAQQRFGGANAVGWLYSAVGAGALVATLVLVKRPVRLTRTKLSLTAFVMIVPLALFSIVHQVWLALALLVITEAAGASVEIWGNSDIQERVPAADLPRANAALFSIWYGGMLVGALGALVLGPLVGWDRALALMCGLAAVLVLAGLAPASRREPATTPLTEIPD